MPVYLSLVIPAYNEEGRIGQTLHSVTDYLSRQEYESEVIVVNDGSTDRTSAVVQTLYPEMRVLEHEPNRGKGYAVKQGMLAGTGEYRVFYDADGSTPIPELEKLWPRFNQGADVVIGSRSLPNSDVKVHQHILREKMGRTFNLFVKAFLAEPFIDTQCGFKGFTARATEICFQRQRLERFSFDAELLHIARKQGLRIDEVPVRWCNVRDSRVKIFTDSPQMVWDLVRVRLNSLLGRYR